MTSTVATWRALGTEVRVLVTDRTALAPAVSVVAALLDEIDAACSRFRPDAELTRVHALAGERTRIGPVLSRALASAFAAAEWTGGLVDPTVGAAIIDAGYDRDFDELPTDGELLPPVPASGWRAVEFDAARSRLRIPAGTRLDLGSTGKAFAADRAACRAADAGAPHGVLVSLGGDIAVGGRAPADGWPVAIADGIGLAPQATVAMHAGALATSSVTQRRWRRGGREQHHIIDPRTGAPADVVWRTVSVTAEHCLWANAASTAAIILGNDAPGWLSARCLPARLVHTDGNVVYTGGWPEDTD